VFNTPVLFYAANINDTLKNYGFQLGEVAEIEAQMFSFAQKFNRRTELNLALNPPFCQTDVRCWRSVHWSRLALEFDRL
jgi:hypothetical protein